MYMHLQQNIGEIKDVYIYIYEVTFNRVSKKILKFGYEIRCSIAGKSW